MLGRKLKDIYLSDSSDLFFIAGGYKKIKESFNERKYYVFLN